MLTFTKSLHSTLFRRGGGEDETQEIVSNAGTVWLTRAPVTSVNKILYNSATQPYFEDDFQLDKYETSVAHYFLNIFTVCHVIYFLRDSFL